MSAESRYRCSDCGHGDRLSAWAMANVFGRLLPDCELGAYVEESDSDQTELYESSIQCDDHPSGRIEKRIDRRWTMEVDCDYVEEKPGFSPTHTLVHRCDGGRVYFGHLICPKCHGRGRIDVPVDDLAEAR
jgi:hypothetical protein